MTGGGYQVHSELSCVPFTLFPVAGLGTWITNTIPAFASTSEIMFARRRFPNLNFSLASRPSGVFSKTALRQFWGRVFADSSLRISKVARINSLSILIPLS